MRSTKAMFATGLAVLLLLSGGPAFSADPVKIGVVDLQKILETSNSGKAAQNELKVQRDKMQADMKQRGNEIQEIESRMQREAMVMSKETREEKEREHRIKVSLRSPLMQARLVVVDPELTFDLPPELTAQTGLDTHDVRRTPHVMPVERVDRSRAHSHQDFIVRRRRPLDVLELEDVGRAIVAIDDRLHRITQRRRGGHEGPGRGGHRRGEHGLVAHGRG